VASLTRDPRSILNLYRKLLAVRRSSAALQAGTLELVASPTGTIAYRRAEGGDQFLVAANFSDSQVTIPMAGEWNIAIETTMHREDVVWDGSLGACDGVLLKRAVS